MRLMIVSGQPGVDRLRLAFLGLFGLFALGVSLFGLTEFMAGYATETFTPRGTIGNALIFSTVENIGLAMALTLVAWRVLGRIPLKLSLLGSVALLALVLVFRAKRLEVVSALVPVIVVLFSTRKAGAASFTQLAALAGLMAMLIVVSALRVSSSLDLFNIGFYAMAEGIYAGHSLPGIAERLEVGATSYEHGMRFLYGLFAFVPRFLWESKDEWTLAGNLALDGVSPLGATTILAEIVLQGGMVAVMIVYGLMGFLFSWLKQFERDYDQDLAAGVVPLRFGFYLIFVAIFIPHFRDGIVPTMKLMLQSTVLLFLFARVTIARGAHGAAQARVSAPPRYLA